jgi:lipoprotein-anchoring transpeptidase ErfK/SrfK
MDRSGTAGRLSLRVLLAEQRLDVLEGGAALRSFAVSTSRHGAGEQNGSLQTPRGAHVIRAKIGAGAPVGAVFRGRRPTGEVYSPELARAHPRRDWILTRILWLSGTEVGKNRLGDVDTMRRYIYIHGTPDTEPLGVPGSIGCIRMANHDVVELFDRVPAGTPVQIG